MTETCKQRIRFLPIYGKFTDAIVPEIQGWNRLLPYQNGQQEN
jgi:hypothetical protein